MGPISSLPFCHPFCFPIGLSLFTLYFTFVPDFVPTCLQVRFLVCPPVCLPACVPLCFLLGHSFFSPRKGEPFSCTTPQPERNTAPRASKGEGTSETIKRSLTTTSQNIPIWWCRLFSWESTIKINNLEITDLIRFAHANPASLRTQENNFGSKYVKHISRLFCKRPATGK